MRITQLISSKGNPVANHFVINTKKGEYLQSYDSVVAYVPRNKFRGIDENVTLGKNWDYSPTTLRHLKHFLNISYSKKEMQDKIDAGVYQVNYKLNYKGE